MAVLKTKGKHPANKARPSRRLVGHQLALILQKMDSAETPDERKQLRRQFMRGFYGDDRADGHA